MGLGLRPEAPPSPIGAPSQLGDEAPVSKGFPAKSALGHLMLSDERLDLGQDGLLFHEPRVSRVITRTSSDLAGNYTKLREASRSAIVWTVDSAIEIDMERLKADMAAYVERTSARHFSLAVTGGKNESFYRNFLKGQDKRLSANVYLGIVAALSQNPQNYVLGAEPQLDLPSATVLTSTFAILLDSLGIDPYEDGRAQKLAASFPDALQSIAALHTQASDDRDSRPAEAARAVGEEKSPA